MSKKIVLPHILTAAISIAAMTFMSACGDIYEAEKKHLPSISKSRPIGTASGPTDAASIKRIKLRMPGADSAWIYSNDDFIDTKRTKDVKANSLTPFEGAVVGFVKFDKPGYLQERVYNDFYGDVYSGWSPRKLELKPSKQPVYISLKLGDLGQTDVVQEVCWFPEGAKNGVLIYSSAYPDVGDKLTAADVYGPEQLGNKYQFHQGIASNAIICNLKNGQFDAAQKILDDSAKLLNSMVDGTDGSSGKKISKHDVNAQSWATLRTYELGMALGEPSFNAKRIELEKVLNGPHWPATTADPTEREYRDMLPIYAWLNQQLVGKRTPLPKPDKEKSYIAGHDPNAVTQYLEADKASEGALAGDLFSTKDFWIAVKNFLRKDFKESDKDLTEFLNDRQFDGNAFEIAAAAKLKDFEFFDLHPEK